MTDDQTSFKELGYENIFSAFVALVFGIILASLSILAGEQSKKEIFLRFPGILAITQAFPYDLIAAMQDNSLTKK